MMTRFKELLLATTGFAALIGGAAQAQAPTPFDIPAADLSQALDVFARQSGVPIVASPALLHGRRSAATAGTLAPSQALEAILAGTGLHAEIVDGAFVVRRNRPAKDGPPAPGDAADIVVTGTRIRGAAPIGSPVMVIDRKAIEESGRATLSDFLQTIPQNYGGGQTEATAGGNSIRGGAYVNTGYGTGINLRGLGSSSTLTLFDGNRPALGGYTASFSDISLIPTVAIDRIEMLMDGASSVYGSDAVAGVVNLRFRNHFEGVEARVFSGTADGAFGQEQASVIAGKRWNTGGVVLAYQFDHRGNLAASDRAYATQDLTRYGGPDNRTGYALPATIIAANGSIYSATRIGTTANPLQRHDLVAGSVNAQDEARQADLLPRQQSHSVYLAADQDVLDGATLYVRALWARRRFDAATLPPDSTFSVMSNNPYYVDPLGTGEPISVERDFSSELGASRALGQVTGLNVAAGVTGALGAWHYEISGGLGRQHDIARTIVPNAVRIDDAAASSDPAAALNPFGPNNSAVLAAIRGSTDLNTRYTVWTSAVRLDGPLVRLPAGPLKLAIGAEYRHDLYHGYEIDDQFYAVPTNEPLDQPPQRRHITSEYAELAIPVLNSEQFPGKLDLSASGRIEQYSDVGTTRNPKFAGRWQPLRSLSIRASWGTSFRAPNLLEKGHPEQDPVYALYLPDPSSPTGQTAVIDKAGYSPDIGPERATTWTAGFDLHPVAVLGLTLSATYFHTDYRDRIDAGAYTLLAYLTNRTAYGSLIEDNPSPAEVAAYFSNPRFSNLGGITPDQVKVITDGQVRNLAQDRIRGIDFDLSYTRKLAGGSLDASVSGTRMLAYRRKFTPGSAIQELASTYGYPVKLRLRGSLGWHDAQSDASVAVNYTGPYHNNLFVPSQPVSPWTTVDLQIGRTIAASGMLGKAHIGLSVTNLLNATPPYIANVQVNSTEGYDAQAASAVGRMIALQGRFSW